MNRPMLFAYWLTQAGLVIAKATGFCEWSWWVVFIPSIASAVFMNLLLCVLGLIELVQSTHKK